MNVTDAVESRRSVRGFLDRQVDLARLRTILERAAPAPSGGNPQSWHIHVITANDVRPPRATVEEFVRFHA